MNSKFIRYSKFLSLVLRHQPQKYGLVLDEHGWAQIDDLIAAAQRAGVTLTYPTLQEVVENNDKRRFAISDDGKFIRASQGHSISVDLGLVPLEPPSRLYHGTAQQFLPSIRARGLVRRSRQYVHLSTDAQTALAVGRRHGQPAVLTVDSYRMYMDGHPFYRSANGIWLVEKVPVDYLSFPDA